tara:strand:- start:1008 stop:1187 length:180 start_codon:yes stop_codon:yes gene_type:complete
MDQEKRLKKIIDFIREEMSAAPTNSTGDGVANYDPVMGKTKKRKPTPIGRYRTRVNWRR